MMVSINKSILSSLLTIGIAACAAHTEITDAHITEEDADNFYIAIEIDGHELRRLYEDDIYFFARVFPCARPSEYYPATPLINGSPATSEIVRHQDELELSVGVPKRLMSNAGSYCLSLNGATYLETKNLKTNTQEITGRDQ